MLEVAHAQIGRVRAYWVEGPPPLAAGLVFGVGQSHEALTTRGVTHLVEHLALAGIGEQHVAFNGTAELLATSFLVRGGADDAAEFLNGVAASLRRLPLERLEREVRILETEAASRGTGGTVGMLLDLRFGASTHGLCNYDELGLKRVTAADVERWRDWYFVDGNAALWFSGPTPPELALDLAPGPSRAAPPLRPLGQQLPAWSGYRPNVVAAGFLAPRTAAFALGLQVLEQRLRNRLRHDEGRSYTVHGGIEALGAEASHGVLVADCLPEEAEAVRDGMLAELSRLAMTGPTAEELEKLAAQAARAWSDPDGASSLASWAAREALAGRSVRPRADALAEMGATPPDAVAAAMADAFESALWLVPGHLGMADRRISEWTEWSSQRANGRAYARAGAPRAPERLVVGSDAVSLAVDAERQITVGLTDCAAVLSWEDGARTVLGATGLQVHVHPAAWVDGERAVATIDASVPGSVVVPMGRPAGAPAAPAPVAPPAGETLAGIVGPRLAPWVAWIFLAFCALGVLGGVLGVVDPEPGEEGSRVEALVVGVAFAALGGLTVRNRLRRRDARGG